MTRQELLNVIFRPMLKNLMLPRSSFYPGAYDEMVSWVQKCKEVYKVTLEEWEEVKENHDC